MYDRASVLLPRPLLFSAISRGATEYKMCNKVNEFCGRHFRSFSPAKYWDKHNIDWIPTLNLGNMEYRIYMYI